MLLHLFVLPNFFSSAGFDEHHHQRTCATITIRLRRFNENYATSPESFSNIFIDLQMTEIVAAPVRSLAQQPTYFETVHTSKYSCY
jgi:hypothetical protein